MNDTEATFTDHQNQLLVIMPAPLKGLLSHRQLRWFDSEAAGVLIGERRGPHLVVYEISEPGPGDIRRRCFVDRRGAHHQSNITEAFERSSGALQYLGEWHTHPEDYPSPSTTDQNSWKRHLASNNEPVILLIIGRKKIWAAKKNNETIVPLEQI